MLIRYINPDKAFARLAKYFVSDSGGYVYTFRANTRTRKVFAKLKRADRAWRRRGLAE